MNERHSMGMITRHSEDDNNNDDDNYYHQQLKAQMAERQRRAK